MHQSIISDHCLSDKHQWTLVNILCRFPPAIYIASDAMRTGVDNLQQLRGRFSLQQASVQLVNRERLSLRSLSSEYDRQLAIMSTQLDMLRQTRENLAERPMVLANGRLRWRIDEIWQKLGRSGSCE